MIVLKAAALVPISSLFYMHALILSHLDFDYESTITAPTQLPEVYALAKPFSLTGQLVTCAGSCHEA